MSKKFSVKDVAETVMYAAEIREAMWNKEVYECATEESLREWEKNHPKEKWYGSIEDPKEFYTMTMVEAIEFACEKKNVDNRLARLIELSFEWWNDVIWWAEEIINKKEK
jgi:hypothetical protein